jgi:predicted metalloprotease
VIVAPARPGSVQGDDGVKAMRYDQSDRESENVEDRRGEGGGMFRFPGGGRGMPIPIPIGGRGGGISLTTLLIIGAIMLFFGINPLDLLTGGGGQPDMTNIPRFPQSEVQRPQRQGYNIPGLPGQPSSGPKSEDAMKQFVSRVLADTEDVWSDVFQKAGRRYEPPKLVLFDGETRTSCGYGAAQMGPFYCPRDRKVYIDLSFYDELARRFRAPGEFAQAYVLAHEVGHHVQQLLGTADQVEALKQRYPQAENQIQVRMELQADCYAGVWAALNDQVKNRLEPGDVEAGLRAASAIGDDRIQRQTQGRVVPDAFTHGSSEQRVRWFRRGLETGQPGACDTFRAETL